MGSFWGYWSFYERAWLFLFCTVAVVITYGSGDGLFGLVVFLCGVFCVVLAAKGSILTYPVGVLNTLGYAWLAWRNGLYGEVGLNILFYLPMNIVGFMMWRHHLDGGIVIMRKLSCRGAALVTVACLLSLLVLGGGLSLLAGQNTPWLDAATNVLSVAATLMMLRRYREQWAAYILLNILSIAMWGLRAAAGSPEGPLMVAMWSAYLVNAFYGWFNWTKGVVSAQVEAAA